MSGRIIIAPVLEELEEFLRATFLEQAHEWALQGLHLSAWHFGDLAVAVNETTSDLLELEVTCHVGMHKNLGQLAGRDDELWDQVNRVVTVASKLGGRLLAVAKLAI